ncbi:MAG: helix-turn-helix domain-containing protein [Aureispira sp.]
MKEIIKIETISQVHDFLQLPKPNHPLVSVIHPQTHLVNVPLDKSRFVFNLFQITLKSTFVGNIQYGRNSYDFQEGTMVFTAPNQVITFDGAHEDLSEEKGWTILFHPDLIRNSNLGQHIDEYSFFSYESHEALHLSDKEKTALLELVDKLEQEINRSIDKHSQKLIVTNIELLLDYCLRYYDRQFYTRTNLNKDTVSKFEQLLKSYYNTEEQLEQGIPSVKYCGKALSLSPNYLSDLLKKETGQNAQEHIHFYVIERAKNKLLNSVGSISQIAYDLGFEYPQHFSKMFKSKTGMSPTEYRRLN